MSNSIHYKIKDLSSTAKSILNLVKSKNILFYGEMGSGKTTLISALVKELGGVNITTSPTFSIVNEYELNDDVAYHFDFYRINDQFEALDMGIEEYFVSNHWNFIEWPEKINDLLHNQVSIVQLSFAKNGGRILQISEKKPST